MLSYKLIFSYNLEKDNKNKCTIASGLQPLAHPHVLYHPAIPRFICSSIYSSHRTLRELINSVFLERNSHSTCSTAGTK